MSKIRTCRVCGCTDERACPGGCAWLSDDPRQPGYEICSACARALGHTLSMTIDHVSAGESYSVATCRCGWVSRMRRSATCYIKQDEAIRAHWQAVVVYKQEARRG